MRGTAVWRPYRTFVIVHVYIINNFMYLLTRSGTVVRLWVRCRLAHMRDAAGPLSGQRPQLTEAVIKTSECLTFWRAANMPQTRPGVRGTQLCTVLRRRRRRVDKIIKSGRLWPPSVPVCYTGRSSSPPPTALTRTACNAKQPRRRPNSDIAITNTVPYVQLRVCQRTLSIRCSHQIDSHWLRNSTTSNSKVNDGQKNCSCRLITL